RGIQICRLERISISVKKYLHQQIVDPDFICQETDCETRLENQISRRLKFRDALGRRLLSRGVILSMVRNESFAVVGEQLFLKVSGQRQRRVEQTICNRVVLQINMDCSTPEKVRGEAILVANCLKQP